MITIHPFLQYYRPRNMRGYIPVHRDPYKYRDTLFIPPFLYPKPYSVRTCLSEVKDRYTGVLSINYKSSSQRIIMIEYPIILLILSFYV